MRQIILTKGQFALVDDWHFEQLNQHQWHAQRAGISFYAARVVYAPKKRLIFMHHEILKISSEFEVDHRDLNRLNNQEYNLRKATHSQNLANVPKHKGQQSKYKGVYVVGNGCGVRPWKAGIRVEGKAIHLGVFATEIEAAKAYDAAAVKFFGEFAQLNFPV